MSRELAPIGDHPDPLALARHAAGEDQPGVADHVRACPTCAAEVRDLRAAIAGLTRPDQADSPGTDCPAEHAIASFIDGTASADERRRVITHIAACPRCGATVAAVAGALSDEAVSREVRAAARPRGRRWAVAAGAVAAVVAMLLLLPPESLDDGTAVHRARSAAVAPAPVLVAPVGAVADARELGWRGVAGADVYRVTVYRADGSVLHEGEVADTVATPAATARLAPGTYYWTVAARTGRDRWTAAELGSFTITAAAR